MAQATAKPLAGKVAIVTGAGKNIGRATALALADDGAAVVVNGRRDEAAIQAVADEISGAGGRALAYRADVSDAPAVAAMVSAAVQAFGGVDIAISNAGLRRQTPFLEMDFAEWREIMSVALDGAFILAKATVPQMIARGGGAFIGLSGMSNHIGTTERVHVNASKAGLEGFIRGLSMELAPHKITVNAIVPGAIATVRGASAGALPNNLGASGVPIGRLGEVEEIAAMIRLLVGPQGGYITGQAIHINGGRFLAK
ncbi:MAG: SDR family NAD(P)-dependent oxidoreductase [Alphaproteobacteria bacterium]